MSNRKTSIRGLKGAIVALGFCALVAVPVGSFLLDEDDPSPSPALSEVPPSARPAPSPRTPAPAPPGLQPEVATEADVEASRARVRQLSALETPELLALASKQPGECRVVMNLLWARGERDQARALAKSDPTLASKLSALEAHAQTESK